ncbi:MAG: YchJ family protein [Alphaproteobacteria bacterium]
MKTTKKFSGPCPCCSRRAYALCCKPWHEGKPPPDAEALMRSRYSAYVLGLEDYLLATWHPETRPAKLDLTAIRTRWTGLKVLRHESHDGGAIVEFVARYKASGRTHELHETSRFVCENGRWFYVDGDIHGSG